jgi:hypothetical protein
MNEDQIRIKKKRRKLIFLDLRVQLNRKFNFTKGSKTKKIIIKIMRTKFKK